MYQRFTRPLLRKHGARLIKKLHFSSAPFAVPLPPRSAFDEITEKGNWASIYPRPDFRSYWLILLRVLHFPCLSNLNQQRRYSFFHFQHPTQSNLGIQVMLHWILNGRLGAKMNCCKHHHPFNCFSWSPCLQLVTFSWSQPATSPCTFSKRINRVGFASLSHVSWDDVVR